MSSSPKPLRQGVLSIWEDGKGSLSKSPLINGVEVPDGQDNPAYVSDNEEQIDSQQGAPQSKGFIEEAAAKLEMIKRHSIIFIEKNNESFSNKEEGVVPKLEEDVVSKKDSDETSGFGNNSTGGSHGTSVSSTQSIQSNNKIKDDSAFDTQSDHTNGIRRNSIDLHREKRLPKKSLEFDPNYMNYIEEHGPRRLTREEKRSLPGYVAPRSVSTSAAPEIHSQVPLDIYEDIEKVENWKISQNSDESFSSLDEEDDVPIPPGPRPKRSVGFSREVYEHEIQKEKNARKNTPYISAEYQYTSDEEESAEALLLSEEKKKEKEERKRKEEELAKRTKVWDVFRDLPGEENGNAINPCFDTAMKVAKLLYMIMSSILVLGAALIAKATFFMAVSQIQYSTENPEISSKRIYCRSYSHLNYTTVNYTSYFDNYTLCVAVPHAYDVYDYHFQGEIDRLSCVRGQYGSRDGFLAEGESRMCFSVLIRWIWCLVLIVATPDVFVFFRCLWRISFKKKISPAMSTLFAVLIIETFQVIGMFMLVFRVLPRLSSSAEGAALMLTVGVVPSFLKLFNLPKYDDPKSKNDNENDPEKSFWERFGERCCNPMNQRVASMVLNILAFIVMLTGILFWPFVILLNNQDNDQTDLIPKWNPDNELLFTIPMSIFLISATWWMNYVDSHSKLGCLTLPLKRFRKNVKKARTKIYLVVSLWRLVVLGVCLTVMFAVEMGNVMKMFDFDDDYAECYSAINSLNSYGPLQAMGLQELTGMELHWMWVWFINCLCCLACYFLARTAAKVQIQFVSYALPLTLVSPIILGFLLGVCEQWNNEPCSFKDMTPIYLFWQCPSYVQYLYTDWYMWGCYIWWLAQVWVAWHIWSPKNERLAKTDKLFVLPLWNSVFIEQWLLYNRNKNDKGKSAGDSSRQASGAKKLQQRSVNGALRPETDDEDYIDKSREMRRMEEMYGYPMIYICATMWHESKEEMISMLTSIFRLDADQCVRRNVQDLLGITDNDYYEFEAHIFFDDAMSDQKQKNGKYERQVNDFVRLLVSVVDTAASNYHGTALKIGAPQRFPTPYGGRLVWTMPGSNKIIVHIKDKDKIRHKKRWSQIMYMYYFLGHKIWANIPDARRKTERAEFTFLLALDGDVDFEPKAVQLLVDLMRKDTKVGAACGRIHPIGSGPMVWYQKFEYALGHWMQKATEHVLGCVLCSPGCFSLFRGSALMDDNVMRTYSTVSTEARHYVQYDQGEDRWLCTLLLQQGYRVEYSAASDSFTNAPEDFATFYNQRRRWTPSTMANIMDLLGSWKRTIEVNENISLLYIIYQAAIFIMSLLGMGTIFLMIVGALQVAVGLDSDGKLIIGPWDSFFINLVPVLFFIILCFFTKSKTQLMAAQLLTIGYALVQMLVFVGILISMEEEGPCSPTSLFFFYVAGTFILAAIIHPQEFFCVIHGFTYFLVIPSMYMLLMIFAITNLNDVSWGTREAKPTKSEEEATAAQELEKVQKDLQAQQKESGGILSSIFKKMSEAKEEGFQVSIGDCLRCLVCPRPAKPESEVQFTSIMTTQDELRKTTEKMQKQLEKLASEKHDCDSCKHKEEIEEEKEKKGGILKTDKRKSMSGPKVITWGEETIEEAAEPPPPAEPEEEKRDEMVNPYWIEDIALGEGPIGKLNRAEVEFFQDLITRYLTPLVQTKDDKERVSKELKELRNQMAFAFFLMNALFVVTVFVLQQNKGRLHVPWPCGDNLELEPIGFMFLIFFGIIMIFQTGGMLMHRAGTFLHLVSATNIDFGAEKKDGMSTGLVSSAYDLIKYMGRFKDDDDQSSIAETTASEDSDQDNANSKKNKTVVKILRGNKREKKFQKVNMTMTKAITRRYSKFQKALQDENVTDEDLQRIAIGKMRGKQKRKSMAVVKNLSKQKKSRVSKQSFSHQTSEWNEASQPLTEEELKQHPEYVDLGNKIAKKQKKRASRYSHVKLNNPFNMATSNASEHSDRNSQDHPRGQAKPDMQRYSAGSLYDNNFDAVPPGGDLDPDADYSDLEDVRPPSPKQDYEDLSDFEDGHHHDEEERLGSDSHKAHNGVAMETFDPRSSVRSSLIDDVEYLVDQTTM